MKKWEYMDLLYSRKYSNGSWPHGTASMLNEYGKDGWELASTRELNKEDTLYVLKRPIEENGDASLDNKPMTEEPPDRIVHYTGAASWSLTNCGLPTYNHLASASRWSVNCEACLATLNARSDRVSWLLTSEERQQYGELAESFPGNRIVYSLTSVERVLRKRLEKNG